jgi:hypothetical protein
MQALCALRSLLLDDVPKWKARYVKDSNGQKLGYFYYEKKARTALGG